jgi:hypothetical protein
MLICIGMFVYMYSSALISSDHVKQVSDFAAKIILEAGREKCHQKN